MDTKAAAVRLRGLLLELEEERELDAEEMRRLRGTKIPPWIYAAVQDILGGYDERERALRREDGARGVLQEYRRLNHGIDVALRAAADGCADRIVELLRRDMIERRGYYNSLLADVMSERKYYELKRRASLYIAANLYLI